jgi:hypothetical protein
MHIHAHMYSYAHYALVFTRKHTHTHTHTHARTHVRIFKTLNETNTYACICTQSMSSEELQNFVAARVGQLLTWGREALINALGESGFMEFMKQNETPSSIANVCMCIYVCVCMFMCVY